jgi:hypothetical protein
VAAGSNIDELKNLGSSGTTARDHRIVLMVGRRSVGCWLGRTDPNGCRETET